MTVAEKAQTLLRRRLCSPTFAHAAFKSSPESNYSKLRLLISSSIAEACNNSVLLLGPRGSGKIAASSDDNSQFVMDMLRECGLAHKTIIFVLDEFDLFTQGKQRLLYSLLDAMQTLISQAVVIGVSCRLTNSWKKELDLGSLTGNSFLFLPLKKTYKGGSFLSSHKIWISMPNVLPTFSTIILVFLPCGVQVIGILTAFAKRFKFSFKNILSDKKFKEILDSLLDVDGSVSNLLRLLFRAVSYMDMESGLLSLENFKSAYLCTYRQPKIDNLKDASILELYILVCMNRLETKEQNSYNFNSIMKEYKAIHDAYKTSDNHANNVCLRAFEHLLEQELIGFTDSKGRTPSIEFRTVKLLISSGELYQGLKSNSSCPVDIQPCGETGWWSFARVNDWMGMQRSELMAGEVYKDLLSYDGLRGF
ncbi:Origin of replication complex subunit 4 [Cocos nucifera]|uniref:Origin of replication complex subunit 4 n=1 Tax=Cocos nucifera TaxID=13894 RepID=A0A8K0N311_COCNU|nr:Origin of replication complex subunit 4 [Cocos nucifera]